MLNVYSKDTTRARSGQVSVAGKIAEKIAKGSINVAVLGDSTLNGASISTVDYGSCVQASTNGWPQRLAYYSMYADPSFSGVADDAIGVALPYQLNGDQVTNGVPLLADSWQAVKSEDPTIKCRVYNWDKVDTDTLTVYVNERTSNGACQFRLTVTDQNDVQLYQGTIDSYVAAEIYNATDEPVLGRVARRPVTLSASGEDYVNVTIDQVVTLDRGSGVSANGSVAIYGFAFGAGVGFRNLAVSSSTLLNNSAANQLRGITTDGQIATANALNTNVWIFGWGTNDSKTGISSVEAYTADLNARISTILTADPNAIVIIATPPIGIGGEYTGNPAYIAAGRAIADARGLPVIDVAAMSADGNLPYADDIHPDFEALNIIAKSASTVLGLPTRPQRFVEPTTAPAKIGSIDIKEGEAYTALSAAILDAGSGDVTSVILQKPAGCTTLKLSAVIGIARSTAIELGRAKLRVGGNPGTIVAEAYFNIPVAGAGLALEPISMLSKPYVVSGSSIEVELIVDDVQVRAGDSQSIIVYEWY